MALNRLIERFCRCSAALCWGPRVQCKIDAALDAEVDGTLFRS